MNGTLSKLAAEAAVEFRAERAIRERLRTAAASRHTIKIAVDTRRMNETAEVALRFLMATGAAHV